MKTIFVRHYDAYGDWITINGLVRYLIRDHEYEKVYLVLEHDESRKHFVDLLYADEPKVSTIVNYDYERICNTEDVIDTRVNEPYPIIGNGNYWSFQNPFGTYIHSGPSSNSDNFYTKLGLSPDIKNQDFFFSRRYDLEEQLFNSLNLSKPYSVVCDYGEHLIDRKYLKYSNIINLHNLSPNFVDIFKILENSDDIHFIENATSLFTYHMQLASLLDNFKIHLHAYARKEPHRRCDGPNCNNHYLNMMLFPKLENWEIIWS